MHHYIAFDTESFVDKDFHRAYEHIEPEIKNPRKASRWIAAAAALEFTITDEGRIELNALKSWTTHDHGDEEAVVSELFSFLRERGNVQALSWGGISHDGLLLDLAAIQYGLVQPAQLAGGRNDLGHWPHFDLCQSMKVGSYVHLSEVAMRTGIPFRLVEDKARVSEPKSNEDWPLLRAHCERDTLMLALVMLSWLHAKGRVPIDPILARHAMVASYRRARPNDPLDSALEHYAEMLKARAFDYYRAVA